MSSDHAVVPPSPTHGAVNTDGRDLQLLAIFHYIIGGFTAFAGLFCLVYIGLGALVVTMAEPSNPDEQLAINLMGGLFAVVGLVGFCISVGIGVVIALAGRYLTQRRRHTFCLVAAGLECLLIPYGTVLGIFTIIVLSRPSVRALFGLSTAGQSAG